MTRLSLVVLVALALPPFASAQDADSTLTADARALLFQIGPSLDLQSVGGGTLSLKWHQSPMHARRLGLTLDLGAATAEAEQSDGPPDRVEDRQDVSVGVNLLFLRYREPRTPIHLYHGLGPTASVRISRDAMETRLEPGQFGQSEYVATSWALAAGLGGALGVEWAVHPAIGLSAEYASSLTVQYNRSTQTSEVIAPTGEAREETATIDRISVGLRPAGARLGLNVYF